MRCAPAVVAVLGVVLGVVPVLSAPAASAHVSVVPEQAERGAWTVLSVRVPDESDTASTVRVEVAFPADTPFASVRTADEPGWTATATTTPLGTPVTVHGRELTSAVTSVVWEAADPAAGIGSGQFHEFRLQVGPLPDVDTLVLPTVQTYDDGTVVRWIERSADGTEPEPPAPSFALAPAATGEAAATGGAGTAGHGAHGAAAGAGADDDDGGAALVGVAALGVALLALVTAAGAWARAGRRAPAGRVPWSAAPLPARRDGGHPDAPDAPDDDRSVLTHRSLRAVRPHDDDLHVPSAPSP